MLHAQYNASPNAPDRANVRFISTAAMPGGAAVYAGATQTLTAAANGTLAAIDGVTGVVGDRFLAAGEVAGANNGIYTITSVGSGGTKWVATRAEDMNSSASATPGMFFEVSEGAAEGGQIWEMTNVAPVTLDTTALTFARKSTSYGTPVNTGTANAAGSATTVPRSDHVHNIGPATLAPLMDAVLDGQGLGSGAEIRALWTHAGGGAADILTIYNANAPFQFRIVDVMLLVSTAGATSTLQLRSGLAGAGSLVSDSAMAATAVGRVRDTGVGIAGIAPQIAANGTLVLRRTDATATAIAGEIVITIVKT